VFSHFMVEKMVCPTCGAHNTSKYSGKKASATSRWLSKTIYDEEAEYKEPTIVLFEECQHRVSGNPLSPDGMRVICDGCKARFNCLTGNIDDGTVTSEQDTMYRPRRTQAEVVYDTKRKEERALLDKLRNYADKVHFDYRSSANPKHLNTWYAHFKGTIWKLQQEDIKAITDGSWSTTNAGIIKKSLEKIKFRLDVAQALLSWELYFRGK
jgi:hypothetical protein